MLLSYDINQMKELMKSFYTLSKIRIVVFNDQYHKVAEVPDHDCDFCRIIRSDGSAEEKCHQSDRYACQICRDENRLHSYTCHAGLTESVAPIRCGNIVVGYIMFGQVLLCEDMEAYWDEVSRRCASYAVEMEDLRRAYNKKRPVLLDQLHASARLLEACAGYLYLQRSISLKEDSLPMQIDEYITNNLHEDLSANALCSQFAISRSKLYKIVGEYYGCGIEQLARSLRINMAKELLKATQDPVSEISHQVGYRDYNYFIKIFKKETGMTPTRYRKQSIAT